MDQAVQTGSIYSSAFPITPEDGANAIGQRYFGPVGLVTDVRYGAAVAPRACKDSLLSPRQNFATFPDTLG